MFLILTSFYNTSREIRKCIIIEKLKIDASYSSGDAATTGIAVGFAYAEIYKLIGFLASIFTISYPEITIKPVFSDELLFEAEAESIIKARIAHIIFTGLKFYSNYKKASKERID